MDYVLKIETYGDNSIRLELPVTWKIGIEQAIEISKQFKSKNWTRNR